VASTNTTQICKARQAKVKAALAVIEPKQKNEVRYELQTALAPLFQPVNDVGPGERPKRTVRRELKNGWIEYSCFEELSIFDESVALAILKISSERIGYLTDAPETELGKVMRKLIDPKDNIKGKVAGMIGEMSLYEIAQNIGFKRPSQQNYICIRASLSRLAKVFVSRRSHLDGVETHGEIGFIQHKILDNGRLTVVITPRLAMASFGVDGWKYALLNLDERNALRGDIAKSAHKFLVSWLWRDGSRPIKLDTLAGHIWWQWDSYSTSGKATFRERLKAALAQLSALPSWKITISGQGSKALVYVTRGEGKSREAEGEQF